MLAHSWDGIVIHIAQGLADAYRDRAFASETAYLQLLELPKQTYFIGVMGELDGDPFEGIWLHRDLDGMAANGSAEEPVVMLKPMTRGMVDDIARDSEVAGVTFRRASTWDDAVECEVVTATRALADEFQPQQLALVGNAIRRGAAGWEPFLALMCDVLCGPGGAYLHQAAESLQRSDQGTATLYVTADSEGRPTLNGQVLPRASYFEEEALRRSRN